MARQLLTMDGRYDRAAIIRRANAELRRAREIGLGWDRAKCLSYVWRQARQIHAEFHAQFHNQGQPHEPARFFQTRFKAAPANDVLRRLRLDVAGPRRTVSLQ